MKLFHVISHFFVRSSALAIPDSIRNIQTIAKLYRRQLLRN